MTDKAEQIAEAKRKLLEKRLKAKRKRQDNQETVETFPKFPDDTPIPATWGQQSMWYVQQIAPDSAVYNMANVMRIDGALNLDWLQQSLDTIVARHEILRTNFVTIDGEIYQQVNPPQSVPIMIEAVSDETLNTAIYKHIEAPFDLASDTLFRATLLQLADDVAVLVIAMHHIISDKWSLEVLIRQELATIYTALSEGHAPELDPIDIQFKDFTAWQATKANTDAYQAKLAYWVEQLSDAPVVLDLPFDKPRPAQQQFDGEVLYQTLPASLTEKLQALSRANNATLFMTLMATYMILLHRMSREDDILVGTSVDLRTHTKLEQSIGYFLNTVVLRQQFEAGQTFQEVLEQVKDTQLTAFANKDVEFEKLVTHLRPNRDISYNPIFQTMFVMWDANNTEPSIPDLTLKTIKLDPNIAKFDLTLYAQVNADNTLLLAFEYATSLFYPETMQRLMRIYETMLESIIAEPTVPINTLNWLPAEQKQIVLSEWTDTEADFPQDVCIHDLIASHDANKIAIRYDGQSVTYGDLNQQANQIAHYLIEQGVTANTPVGIMVERSVEMLVGIVAILKAGGAYVPIDPAYPDERIAFLLQDSGISILLTQSHLDVNGSEITRVNLDETVQFNTYSHNTPQAPVTPNDLAYIIYTSGSTGTPKGVRATHRNLVHSTTTRFDVYEHEIERFLLLSSFAFDSSLVGIFWTLAGGGTLVLPPHGGEHDVKLISRMIQQEQVTHLLALPSLYSILLEFSDSDALNSLNTVMVAGEACPPELVKTHFTQLPDTRLYNEYGPTEGTVWATVSEILPETKHVTIGRAIPNVQTYIVDSHLQSVPIGMHGELLIGGEGITQGYHQRPELTKERFIKNPFGVGRLYRTGDLARYLPNGEIDFLGRIDRQVKVSGYRIELGEIESALLAYDGVRESVVLPVTEQNTRLVAFITTQDDVDKTALRSHLGTQLPQYMIPSVIQVLEAIPRTPNGKINHQALLQQVETEPTPNVSTDPCDVSEVEAQLITIWEELLETQITSVDDNFFNIGGYSLLAIRLLGRINQAFDIELPTTAIMQAPTIAQLAELIQLDNQAQEAIVRLSDVDNGLPIYCLQVNRFGVLHYQTLIEALRDSYPIYGVTIPNADDYDQITIEQSAQIFADAILKQGVAQPIVLVGLSVSGVVAYEVARLLKPHDIRVHVVMIDTQGPQYPSYQSAFDVLPKKASLIAQEFANEPLSNWGNIIYEMVWIIQFRLRFQLRKRANWVLTKLNLPVIANKDMEDLRLGGEHVSDLKDQYFAQNPTDETIEALLYRGRLQPLTAKHEWALGWDKMMSDEQIEVVSVYGPHSELLKYPYFEKLFAHLRQWLAERSM